MLCALTAKPHRLTCAAVGVLALAMTLVPPAAAPPAGRASGATLATFAGTWLGHTRELTISRRGRAFESIYSGCCDHGIDVRFRISRRLRLRDGVLTEPFTKTSYCNRAADRRGVCGA